MNEQRLMEALVASAGKVQSEAEVIGLKQYTLDELQARTRQFLALLGEREARSLDRGDWQAMDGQTVIRLPQGARAMLYHASGAMKYTAGYAPFDALFERVAPREELTRVLTAAASQCKLEQWAGERGEIVFERLWQTKAQGADRSGKLSEPVLCRIVGAYRHFLDGIPVLGAASVALKLTGNHAIDMLSVQVRPVAAETIDKARILSPEAGARQVALQLSTLLGRARDAVPDDALEEVSMRFGYLDLGKRKAQRLLAPAYMAQVTLRHKLEQQAYVFAVAATEKAYLPLCQCGGMAPAVARRQQASLTAPMRG